jgi:predicted nucleic acid-binding protein
MSDFIIDANILMSILISGKASYRPILNYYRFIVPDFVFLEIDKYSSIILEKTKLNEEEFKQWSCFVFSQIRTFPRYILSEDLLIKSNHLLKDIDLKDTSYVALSMELNLVLLTRDDILYKGLRKKGFRKVMKFDDFLRNI